MLTEISIRTNDVTPQYNHRIVKNFVMIIVVYSWFCNKHTIINDGTSFLKANIRI